MEEQLIYRVIIIYPLTVYLKTGAAVILPPSINDQMAITVVKESGASVSNLSVAYPGYYYQPTTVLTCTSGLIFDYANVTSGGSCITNPLTASGQSVSITGLSSTSLCPGSTLTLNYTASGSFGSGNSFVARLSESTGSFTTYTYVGSTFSNVSGTISCTIPSNLSSGNNYLIEVIATNPSIISAPTTNLSLGVLPSGLNISSSSPNNAVLLGQSVSFVANVSDV